jgi:hypothetical protein
MCYKYKYVLEWYMHGFVHLLEEAAHWWHFLISFTVTQVRLISPVATGGSAGVKG